MNDRLEGWPEIADYLGVHPRTAQRYELTRALPVHRLPGAGRKAPVYASRSELDAWRGKAPSRAEQALGDRLVERIKEISNATALYRKNLVVRFSLRSRGFGVEAHVEIEYELVNGSSERQPYVQEITLDDPECGHLETMWVAVDGRFISQMVRPQITEQRTGHVAYCSRRLMIEPTSSGRRYTGKQEFFVNRKENDYWYLHVGIMTFGVTVETNAPPAFEITPCYSEPGALLTAGQHIDITWKRRRRPR